MFRSDSTMLLKKKPSQILCKNPAQFQSLQALRPLRPLHTGPHTHHLEDGFYGYCQTRWG